MSQASIEEDLRLAQDISRSLNANPRRASALQSNPTMSGTIETPLSKKRKIQFKKPAAELPTTPVSLNSTPTDGNTIGFESPSSPLSSLESFDKSLVSDLSLPVVLQPVVNRYGLRNSKKVESLSTETIKTPVWSRKSRGLTDITISFANTWSIPSPGPGLLMKVNDAKETGEVPMLYDSSVIRYVDGKWLAPQICTRCREISFTMKNPSKGQNCNRGNPCSVCTNSGAECLQGSFMTYVFGTKRLSQALKPYGTDVNTGIAPSFTESFHVCQNLDGTWEVTKEPQSRSQRPEKRKAVESIAPLQRRRGPPRSAFLQMNGHALQPVGGIGDTDDTACFENNNGRPFNASKAVIQSRQFPKRRSGPELVEDFQKAPTAQITRFSEESVSDTAVVESLKRKITTNRAGGFVKYHRSMQEDKPEPCGEPPVWADKRQSLCETLPYYRAYMSGAYMHLQVVRAFMVDKEVGPRDKFEEEIMISRVGGGRKLDEQTGQMIQKADQDKSPFALGFQRAMKNKSPIAIIAGQGNRISISKLPHYYNVLDWFHVTDVWCEKSTGYKCWMVRLEKICLRQKSWWAPIGSRPLNPIRDINAIKASIASCILCRVASKYIYNAGWTCLNTTCDAYFNFSQDVDDATLDYNEDFMNERTIFTGDTPGPLAPPLLTDNLLANGEFGFERGWNTGIVCPTCKGCSRRTEWRQWRCETPGCNFTYTVPQKTMKVHDAISEGFTFDLGSYDKTIGIRFSQKTMGMYDVFEYMIPGDGSDNFAGIIRHFSANGIINGQPDGPNDLFRYMQESDFGLRRYPARQKGSTGEILTSHFAANWGAPYKYGVSVLSKGFDEAPLVIIKALKRLTWAGQQTVGEMLEPFHRFNELLSIGYFEDTAIGYHDDGEKELGPTVATLSLGGQALMTLRPKAKANVGRESKNAKGTKLDILKMVLRHGDLVVMHGTGIQRLYEHAVTPQGKLRFALTCRYVRPELMANDDERQQAEIKGALPSGHEAYEYDGDAGKSLIPLGEDSEHVLAAQRAMNELSARALAGELNVDALRQCRQFLNGLMDGMGVPEGRASSPPLLDIPMEDAK